MRVLVIGSGGREHALCWKIAQSPLVDEVFCAPGNAGIAEDAVCVDIGSDDTAGLLRFAKDNAFDLTVVGPEAPLVGGIADAFLAEGLPVFGPGATGAMLEGSKAFAKDLMSRCGIPTAAYRTFSDASKAREYVEKEARGNVVVKADGLAAGKGVVVARTREEALQAIEEIMARRAFGAAGDRVVVEEMLEGEEASFIAVCDGENVLSFASSQDHKRLLDNDEGPNTGGMGAYSPAPVVDVRMEGLVMDRVIEPLVWGLKKAGITYRGVLYAGLMITDEGPFVLEFNVRMGDPETQPLLVRCASDIVPVMLEVARGGSVKSLRIDSSAGPAVCVVAASEGYPGPVVKGRVIEGIEEAAKIEGVKVFHAGTTLRDKRFVTNGGRVLGVTATGDTLTGAIAKAYSAVSKISFEGMHYRRDIGKKAIGRMP
ncbi:MAG TPA: phosphoribosylamine--glycine ligase [Deltaproteobacteria bacterium]|nr:phosphoribosylamine--glycine ligase [Deltaproteobacteria bacterium]HPP79653.1 phosphoribosylamine--glycine ligase [Deltaproteobacteria bacterium]